ncbi:MAG: amidase family protein [Pseudoxanthomonas sp.]
MPSAGAPLAGGLPLAQAMDIGRLDAHAQARLVARGELSAAELVEAAIARVECLDGGCNAVSHRAFGQARARAATLLPVGMAGVPCLLKDGLDWPGMPSRVGSRALPATPVYAWHPYPQRLYALGLVPLGKTNAPEFGLLPSTEPLLYGPARNPWAPDRSAGGSSGGSAAAVAAGMVPLAHAADGGGSIRIPASCCGVVGLKPGRDGNLRARGQHAIEDLLVGDALLARSVRDADWALRELRGPAPLSAPPARKLRIGVCTDALSGAKPHPQVLDAIVRTAELCDRLGHRVERCALPVDGARVEAAFRVLWGYLARDVVERCRLMHAEHALESVLEPWTLALAGWAGRLQGSDLEGVATALQAAQAGMDSAFARFDLLLSPVVREPPPPLGQLAPTRPFDELMAAMFDYVCYTPLHNLTGLPAISLPLFQTPDGLPVGSMFAAARHREATLLALAYELEQACPWGGRWPAPSMAQHR